MRRRRVRARDGSPPKVLKVCGSSLSSAESSFRELDDAFLQTQTRIWLGEVLHMRFDEETNIAELLADGELLFKVSKVVWKMLLKQCGQVKYSKWFVHEKTSSGKTTGRYMAYPKVDSFLQVCQILGLTGVDLFSPSDVVEKRDTRRVCMCIRSLSKKARSKHLNVPDFDIVSATCTIKMPTDMVGYLRRNLEQACSVSSCSYLCHQCLHARPIYRKNKLFKSFNQDHDILFEFKDAKSPFQGLEFHRPVISGNYSNLSYITEGNFHGEVSHSEDDFKTSDDLFLLDHLNRTDKECYFEADCLYSHNMLKNDNFSNAYQKVPLLPCAYQFGLDPMDSLALCEEPKWSNNIPKPMKFFDGDLHNFQFNSSSVGVSPDWVHLHGRDLSDQEIKLESDTTKKVMKTKLYSKCSFNLNSYDSVKLGNRFNGASDLSSFIPPFENHHNHKQNYQIRSPDVMSSNINDGIDREFEKEISEYFDMDLNEGATVIPKQELCVHHFGNAGTNACFSVHNIPNVNWTALQPGRFTSDATGQSFEIYLDSKSQKGMKLVNLNLCNDISIDRCILNAPYQASRCICDGLDLIDKPREIDLKCMLENMLRSSFLKDTPYRISNDIAAKLVNISLYSSSLLQERVGYVQKGSGRAVQFFESNFFEELPFDRKKIHTSQDEEKDYKDLDEQNENLDLCRISSGTASLHDEDIKLKAENEGTKTCESNMNYENRYSLHDSCSSKIGREILDEGVEISSGIALLAQREPYCSYQLDIRKDSPRNFKRCYVNFSSILNCSVWLELAEILFCSNASKMMLKGRWTSSFADGANYAPSKRLIKNKLPTVVIYLFENIPKASKKSKLLDDVAITHSCEVSHNSIFSISDCSLYKECAKGHPEIYLLSDDRVCQKLFSDKKLCQKQLQTIDDNVSSGTLVLATDISKSTTLSNFFEFFDFPKVQPCAAEEVEVHDDVFNRYCKYSSAIHGLDVKVAALDSENVCYAFRICSGESHAYCEHILARNVLQETNVKVQMQDIALHSTHKVDDVNYPDPSIDRVNCGLPTMCNDEACLTSATDFKQLQESYQECEGSVDSELNANHEERGIENNPVRKLISVAGGMTILGSLFFLFHSRWKKGVGHKIFPQLSKQRARGLHPREAVEASASYVFYPGERLRF